jgi:hypothetical protein
MHLRSKMPSAAASTVLLAFVEDCPGARWSARDLASLVGVSDRQVRRAFEAIATWPGIQLVEEHRASCVQAGDLPVRRWIVRTDTGRPGGRTLRLSLSSLDSEPLEPRPDRELKEQNPDRPPVAGGNARRRARAPSARVLRSTSRATCERRPRPPSGARGAFARAARRTGPLSLEEAVWRALRAQHGGRAATVLRGELCFEKYHQHPLEADRAARTFAQCRVPDGVAPLQYFRGLFKRALRGDLLADKAALRQADRDATLAALMRTAPLSEEPPEAWRAFRDDLDARLAAVRVSAGGSEHAEVLERALRRATDALRAALARQGQGAEDFQIARAVGLDPRPLTPEERMVEFDLRIAVADAAHKASATTACYLEGLSLEVLEETVRQGLVEVEQLARAGQWLRAESVARQYAKYQHALSQRRAEAQTSAARTRRDPDARGPPPDD